MSVVRDPEASVSRTRRPQASGGEGLAHVALFVVTGIAIAALVQLYIGFVVLPFAMRKTGRRGRDTFAILIPLYGAVLFIQTMWRMSAGQVYWSPRSDLPSSPMFFYGTGRAGALEGTTPRG
jgi:hypothetical protein